MTRRLRTGAAPLALLLLSGCLPSAVVERVIDGDTVVLAGGRRVRLLGIDAPERGEPGADAATARLRDLVQGRRVRLDYAPPLLGRTEDMYGRLLARISVGRADVAAVLLDEGHARPCHNRR